jgi:antitoxin component of MazEF toxin-antitoxin module
MPSFHKLRATGNSLAVTLPKHELRSRDIREGDLFCVVTFPNNTFELTHYRRDKLGQLIRIYGPKR